MPTLLWADLTNVYVWIAVIATAAVRRDRVPRRLPEDHAPLVRGLSARYKFGLQFVVGLALGLLLMWLAAGTSTTRG